MDFEKIRVSPPKSVCLCGHTGDGMESQHEDTMSPGHGPCKLCECRKFTWAKYLPAGEVAVAEMQKEKSQRSKH